jgi:hypothetical protein
MFQRMHKSSSMIQRNVRWKPSEDESLRAMYATHTRAEIAKAIGKTEGAVRSRCWTLRLCTKVRPWSETEVDALRRAYSAQIAAEVNLPALATQLGRDKTNVCRKARALGLTSPTRPRVAVCKVRVPKFATEEERRASCSVRAKQRIAERGHPRGALGMKHTAETKESISRKHIALWADPTSKFNSEQFRQKKSDMMTQRNKSGLMPSGEKMYSRAKKGKRSDIGGKFFRSRWEANYARYLDFMKAHGRIKSWEYEVRTFWFESIKRGTRSYTPDFLVTYTDGRHEWHEVKGWMDAKSKTRLRRMAEFYPAEKLVIIEESWFRGAKKTGLASVIRGWESAPRKPH